MILSHISTFVSYLEIPVYFSPPFSRGKTARGRSVWESLACVCTLVLPQLLTGTHMFARSSLLGPVPSTPPIVGTQLPHHLFNGHRLTSLLLLINFLFFSSAVKFPLHSAGNYYAAAGANLKLCPNYNMSQVQPLPF